MAAAEFREDDLSGPQRKALEILRKKGALYAGNEYGVVMATARALGRRGFGEFENLSYIVWRTPALGLQTRYWQPDWALRLPDVDRAEDCGDPC